MINTSELTQSIAVLAEQQGLSEVEVITMLQTGAAASGLEELLDALCYLKRKYIPQETGAGDNVGISTDKIARIWETPEGFVITDWNNCRVVTSPLVNAADAGECARDLGFEEIFWEDSE